ncbi:Rxt3-domain-containing protein [Tothia fuscella]|uniref:Rxt3-domain-containing protein n=1 Tax=Tothia fuscella TaxID=1048955 RepID=A0A9P4NNH6_9PEZI|nr:Rxt3-domain-containing protein [Tothia fuscella]
MDQRQPPHSYSRSQDRPLIHNPNHQPPTQQQQQQQQQSHSTLFHPPSSQQPPVQIPFSDPFQRRAHDPFLPNTQGQRRGSYGLGRDAVSGGGHGERPQLAGAWPPATTVGNGNGTALTASLLHQHHQQQPGGPPPPSNLSSVHAGPSPAPYPYDRRRSISGQSPPRYYGGASAESSAPLAAYSNRQMPPPSPSQQPSQAAPYPGGRGPIHPPPFSNGRELPGLGSTPRAGTGMSISSILDTGAPPSHSSGPSQHSPTAANQSPSSVSMQPPSPRRAQNIGRMEYGPYRRPNTPDRHALPAGLRASENSYSANSSPRIFPGSRGSPEYNRSGPPLLQHFHQTAPGPGGGQYQSSPNEQHAREQPPRPNSQPAGYGPLTGGPGFRDTMAVLAGRQPIYGSPFDRKSGQEDQRQPHTPGFMNGPQGTSRDRPITVDPTGHVGYSPPRDPRSQIGREASREEPRESGPRREDFNGMQRTGFRGTYYSPTGNANGPEAPRSHPQGMDPFRRPNEGPHLQFGPGSYDRTPHSLPMDVQGPERRTSEPQAGNVHEMQYKNPIQDQGLLMQRSRSSLGIGLEGKRGRASPLPQAVQGAQAQLVGPGADPSIKSEFGRIFQGLGSGIGGHISGISTPPRQSPMPRGHAPDNEAIVLSDGEVVKMSRMTSKAGQRKGRRVKEEDSKMDSDSIEGRGTPLGTGTRGAKRSKVGHHHHVHQHPHTHAHHHHVHGHVHRPEDDANRPTSISNATPTPSAHHHHHIPHHHHQTPRPVAAPIVPLPKPTLQVTSQAVLDSVRDLPSNHLGSELYNPQISLPPHAANHSNDKYGYFSKHKSERNFTSADFNCTFTIRVPREYLTREAREKICSDRYVFGMETYTDDSDPLAMCVHSGWIRGEWPEEVDTNLMDVPPPPPADEMIEADYTSKPEYPIVPPDGFDLHITVRILPPCVTYPGRLMYGILSREAGSEHDGQSWFIDRIDWVDEGNSRMLGRNGKAKRARLEAAQGLVNLFERQSVHASLGAGKGMDRGMNVAVTAMVV